MTTPKINSKLLLLIIVLVLGLGGLMVARRHNNAQPTTPAPTQTTSVGTDHKDYVDTTDLKYPLPKGWTTLSQAKLNAQQAVSGITNSATGAEFSVAIEPGASSPASQPALNSDTLDALKRFPNFTLVTNDSLTIGGQAAQRFVYKLDGQPPTKNVLIVSLHNKQAFSLLFTSKETDFDSLSANLSQIIAGYSFK